MWSSPLSNSFLYFIAIFINCYYLIYYPNTKVRFDPVFTGNSYINPTRSVNWEKRVKLPNHPVTPLIGDKGGVR